MNNEKMNTEKKLSLVKLVYLFVFLAIIGMVVLVAAGTFKSPTVSEVKSFSQDDHNHGSVDMNSLAEIKSLEAKVANNPNDLVSLLSLSHLLNDSGFYEKAITNYKKYLAKDSKNVDVMIDMGVCYYQTGDYDSAIRAMEKGIEINPKHQIGNFNLGIVNTAKGDISKSKEYFAKAVKLNPSSDIGIKAQDLLDNH
jgi:tetratricopeptide (TPR) repeat protein